MPPWFYNQMVLNVMNAMFTMLSMDFYDKNSVAGHVPYGHIERLPLERSFKDYSLE